MAGGTRVQTYTNTKKVDALDIKVAAALDTVDAEERPAFGFLAEYEAQSLKVDLGGGASGGSLRVAAYLPVVGCASGPHKPPLLLAAATLRPFAGVGSVRVQRGGVALCGAQVAACPFAALPFLQRAALEAGA